LRGQVVLPEPMQNTAILGVDPYGPLAADITDVLKGAGARVASPGEAGDAILSVSGERFERRVASLDATGKATEYELRYVLDAVLLDAEGRPLISPQSASVTRTYAYDADNVLANASEEEMLRSSMRQSGVRQLLRQIRVALRRALTAAPPAAAEGAVAAPESPARDAAPVTPQ
jgi:LPS-assembly lipoprotein